MRRLPMDLPGMLEERERLQARHTCLQARIPVCREQMIELSLVDANPGCGSRQSPSVAWGSVLKSAAQANRNQEDPGLSNWFSGIVTFTVPVDSSPAPSEPPPGSRSISETRCDPPSGRDSSGWSRRLLRRFPD